MDEHPGAVVPFRPRQVERSNVGKAPDLLEALSDLCQCVGLPAFVRKGRIAPKIGALIQLEEKNGDRYLVLSRAHRSQLVEAQAPLARFLELLGLQNPRSNIVHSNVQGGGYLLSFHIGAAPA